MRSAIKLELIDSEKGLKEFCEFFGLKARIAEKTKTAIRIEFEDPETGFIQSFTFGGWMELSTEDFLQNYQFRGHIRAYCIALKAVREMGYTYIESLRQFVKGIYRLKIDRRLCLNGNSINFEMYKNCQSLKKKLIQLERMIEIYLRALRQDLRWLSAKYGFSYRIVPEATRFLVEIGDARISVMPWGRYLYLKEPDKDPFCIKYKDELPAGLETVINLLSCDNRKNLMEMLEEQSRLDLPGD